MGFYFIVTILASVIGYITAQDCAWNKDTEFPTNYPPLLIDKASWISLKPVLEGGNRIVRETEGASIVVACSGTVITSLGVQVAEGVCSQGNILIGTQSYTILELACSSRIRDSVSNGLGSCGSDNIGTLNNLGFTVPGYPFYPILDLCFEPTNQITLWAHNIIYGKSVTASDGNPDRPSFKDDNVLYPTINPNDCYLTANQKAYATAVTGNPDLIDLDATNYFARSHLAPNADFLVEMEADATFWYSNAVPQWQKYNAANWAYVESASRQLANTHQVDLEITTGPWEILTFLDINSVRLDAYICDSQSQHIIPVPLSMWKTIYDPVLDQGLAVITSNLAYQTVAPTPVCPAIDCNTVPWLLYSPSFDPFSFIKGYTYCCTVQDLHVANPHTPDYPTAGLLLN